MTFQLQDDFDIFWKAYPRKVGSKKKAKTTWSRLSKKVKKLIMIDLETRYKDTERGYIHHPTTYLNGAYWEVEKEEKESDKATHISSDDFIREELAKKPQPKPLRSKEESEDGINNLQRIMECVK